MTPRAQRFLCCTCLLLITACAGTFYAPSPDAPTAKVRFVATYRGNTEFLHSSSAECDAKFQGKLGWFHPSAEQSFQSSRRGFDRREGIPGGEAYQPHMYSELRVDVNKPFFVTVSSTASSGASVSPFDVQICVRAAELPLKAGREYELVHIRDGNNCDLRFLEITRGSTGAGRFEIELAHKSPQCTGHGTPRS